MTYALVALGFVLALNASGAVNFAHGDLVVLGGAAAVVFGLWTGLPAPLLLPLVALALALAGVIAARLAILPLISRPAEATFVATIALAAMIEQALTVTLGAGTAHRAGHPGQRQHGPRRRGGCPPAARHRLVGGALVVADVVSCSSGPRPDGACARSRPTATWRGRSVSRWRAISRSRWRSPAPWPESRACCWPPVPGVADPGRRHMLKAYIAVALGGWGSVPGALVAALGSASSRPSCLQRSAMPGRRRRSMSA
jgi:branched-chain amino acid transport system permease protein